MGQFTNILSNDVNQFDTTLEYTPYLIIGPLQLILVVCILWNDTGPSSLFGVFVLVFIICVQGNICLD